MKIIYKETQRVLDAYCKEYESTLKNNLIDKGKSASGNLISSIETKVMHLGEWFTIKLNTAPYMRWVEEGRKPGKQPPIEDIVKWLKVKNIIPYKDKKGKIPTQKQLAFLIARSIGKKGTKPTYAIRYTKSALTNKYNKLLKEALSKDYSKQVTNNFRTIVIYNKNKNIK